MSEAVTRYRRSGWWDVVIALVFFAVALVLYATDLYALVPQEQLPLGLLITQSAVLCVAQMLRRRAPLVMLAIATGILLGNLSYGLPIPVIIVFVYLLVNATLSTTRRGSRFILAGAIVTVLTVGVADVGVTGDWRHGFFTVLNVFSLLIVPVWWSFNIRQHDEILEAERASSRQLHRIAELDRRTAVADERAWMARDLHDVVAGHLSAIAIQAEALLSVADRDPQLVRTVLKSVRENSIQSLAEMRAMIDVLQADNGEKSPRTAPATLAELDRLVDSARAGGLVLEIRRAFGDLPVAVDLAAYRIVQEALTNALKHASGGSAAVEVRVEDTHLIVEVTNDLTGPPGAGAGTGLVSMRERAHAVGGDFQAGPWSGGWRVRAVLPLGQPMEEWRVDSGTGRGRSHGEPRRTGAGPDRG
ncbi:Integral membrane sensor signal transduction histidine kinase [Kibdelosporangium sp. 4NS15]|uniref:histidine kinase n=1 Tax=Kibdelosporangium persicum TaxID=2698649 RepID=A0ABX2F8Y5_9PSEU|nr:histidine kinase [Kibdelosporangium persicum]NRN67288.1 Integral membrane sensor signal transduction histidine kinase [Kibdelosporangium persicum]